MQNRTLIAAYLGLAMTLAACSTSPVTEQSGKPVPSDRIYKPDLLNASPDRTAKVTFLRDSGFMGSGCPDNILVNGTAVFTMHAGEYETVFLAPGKYFFSVETGRGPCPDVVTSQNTELSAGDREVYRVLRPSDYSVRLTRIR